MSYKTDNCKSCHDQRNWVIVMKASQAHSSPIRNEQNYEKRMTKGKELEVPEDSETVKSFLRRVDRLRQLYYNVIVLFCTHRRNQGAGPRGS